jgi:hypothetical protein
MARSDLLSFIIGAAAGAVATYYVIKHQDEIVAKIEELEGRFDIDHNELVGKAKVQFEKLSAAFSATIEKYSGMIKGGTTTEEQKVQIIQELDRIRNEVQTLASEKA